MSSPLPPGQFVPTPQDVEEAVARLTPHVTDTPFDGGTVRVSVDDLRVVLAAAKVAGPIPGTAVITGLDGSKMVAHQDDPRDVHVPDGIKAAGLALQGDPTYGSLFSGDPAAMEALAGFVVSAFAPRLVAAWVVEHMDELR